MQEGRVTNQCTFLHCYTCTSLLSCMYTSICVHVSIDECFETEISDHHHATRKCIHHTQTAPPISLSTLLMITIQHCRQCYMCALPIKECTVCGMYCAGMYCAGMYCAKRAVHIKIPFSIKGTSERNLLVHTALT